MPWHYHDPFFQETPAVFKADLDKIYAKPGPHRACAGISTAASTCRSTWSSSASNDFKPAKGKNPHAFCTDITRDGTDVRVLANIVPNDYWMSTMLHEFGHSVYSSINIPEKLPYVLRMRVAHPDHRRRGHDVREAVQAPGLAREDGRQGRRSARRSTRPAAKMLRYQLLIFSRWCQVMLRFEKGMYENPSQDLNKLWWDMVEKYQLRQAAAGPQRPGLRQQDPHRQRPGLLPQLHDGRAVRLAAAPRHRPRSLQGRRSRHGGLRRQQGGGPVHEAEASSSRAGR